MVTRPANPIIKPWLLATFLGWLLGFALMIGFGLLSGLIGRETQLPIGLGMGLGVGLLQSRIVAQYVGARRNWIFASTFGLSIPFFVTDFDDLVSLALPYSLPVSIVVGGLIVGLLQWRILSSRGGSVWWIPACTLGWALAGAMALLNERVVPRTMGVASALLYVGVVLFGGVLLGAATGPVLQRILILNPARPARGRQPQRA